MSEFLRIQRVLSILAGLALMGATFSLDVLVGINLPEFLSAGLLVAGCILIVLGVLLRPGRAARGLAKSALVILSVIFMLGLCEFTFRVIEFDFDPPDARIPIFNRGPNWHMGGGILRRPGPASWRGKPLSSLIQYSWGRENAYPEEQAIEIRYDRQGFRNPPGLVDWEVVVAGDSFVESGYLPYEEIFSTLAAKRLGIRIKNLGVSGTGPVFQTAYVQKYGKAPATKNAVLCFFEANDVSDLIHEVHDTNFICRTGYRLGRRKQSSLVMAVDEKLRRLNKPPVRYTSTNSPPDAPLAPAKAVYPTVLVPNAFLVIGTQEYPATIWPIPPKSWENLKRDTRALVTNAMAHWGTTVRAQGMQPWVMCIPDSRRIWQGHLRYAETNSPIAQWHPDEFSPHLAKICAALDIRFIDPLPALQAEVEAGRTPYNFFGDGHLSAQGSRVVADVLAEALRAEVHK